MIGRMFAWLLLFGICFTVVNFLTSWDNPWGSGLEVIGNVVPVTPMGCKGVC